MRVQWQILLFLIVFNLGIGLVIALNLAGTEYFAPTYSDNFNGTLYEEQFNATSIAQKWSATPFSGIPVIGDIFAGFDFLWQMIGYMADGLPTLLLWMGNSFISDASGLAAFTLIANALRAVYAVLFATFLIEFISGRVFTD